MRLILLLLVTTAVTVALVACAGTPPTITPSAQESESSGAATKDPSAEEITVDVHNTQLALGLERVAFSLTDASGQPVSTDSELEVIFYKVSEPKEGQEQLQRSASGGAVYFGKGMPHGGSWVVYNDFDSSGEWILDVTASSGGWKGQGRASMDVAGRTSTPRIGAKAPSTDTPYLHEGVTLEDLTSDDAPVQALYKMSLAEALQTGKPTALLFASPAHCDSDDCRATLAEFKKVLGQRGGSMNFIHVESKDLKQPDQQSATAEAWGLPTDLWTFLLDDKGFVLSRIEGPVDAVELGLVIDEFVKQ